MKTGNKMKNRREKRACLFLKACSLKFCIDMLQRFCYNENGIQFGKAAYMRSYIRLFGVLVVALLLAFTVCAKETVIYENDFSGVNLVDFSVKGNWTVSGGMLSTGAGSGSAYLHYTIPKAYAGCDYMVEVDFIGHTSTGGIQIGGTAPYLPADPVFFHGFDCFTGSAGDKAAVGCYKTDGNWLGNVIVSDPLLPKTGDLHMTVYVSGNTFTYRVYSLDRKTQYFGAEYTVGQHTRDAYNGLTGTVGLRKFYADHGSFDNFRVTVYTNDVLPILGKKIELGGASFLASSISKRGDAVTGNGAMLTEKVLAANFKATLILSPKGNSKVFFGMSDAKNGFAFSIDESRETLYLHKIVNGEYIWLASRRMPVGDGAYPVTVSVHDGIASVLYDAYLAGDLAFPSFEMQLEGYSAGKFGFWLEGGEVSALTFSDSEEKSGTTYLNPVFDGADPEIIYHDGTYYAYRRVSGGDGIVRVFTSPDLVHWMERNIVYSQKSNYTGNSYMSPNVFYNKKDGYFYLFLAGKNADKTAHCIYYAYSTSPYGPFEHFGGEQTILHNGISEIGGAPFLDDDGKFYLSFCRFGNGNHIFVEEFTLQDGIVTPVPGTLSKVISPVHEYEIDGHGNISEGGIFTKHNGKYYMIWATGHYLGHYGQGYAVADHIGGPYTRYEYNDIITYNSQVDGVGDCIFVKSPDGKELWVAYHQHKEIGTVELRRTRIDRVQFIPNPDGGPDILTINAPTTTPQYAPSFEGRYDLDGSGFLNLKDLFVLLKWQASASRYNGRYDFDSNGRNDFMDSVAMIEKITDD